MACEQQVLCKLAHQRCGWRSFPLPEGGLLIDAREWPLESNIAAGKRPFPGIGSIVFSASGCVPTLSSPLQLIEIADSPYHVFAVNQGFKALKDIVDPVSEGWT